MTDSTNNDSASVRSVFEPRNEPGTVRTGPATSRRTCVIVVPCYNEEKRLNSGAFRSFVAQNSQVAFLFVNDGSTDGTLGVLEKLRDAFGDSFMVLNLERNSGKSEAIRRGMQEAFRLRPMYVGYWDADLATPLQAILDFTVYLDRHPQVEMLFGARVPLMGHRIVRRPIRHQLGRVFPAVASRVLGIGIYDTQCGAKLFRSCPAVQQLFEQPFWSRWNLDIEILARFLHEFRAVNQGAVDDLIHEIPVSHWEDVAGSKMRLLDFIRPIHELWVLHRTWLRKGWSPTHPVLEGTEPPGVTVLANLQKTSATGTGPVMFRSVNSMLGDTK
jgi:dolichyl-phosphate beta-glucosyltransferase